MTRDEAEKAAKGHLGITAAVEVSPDGTWTVATLVPVHNPQGGPPIRIDRKVEGRGASAEEALLRAGLILQQPLTLPDANGRYRAAATYFCREDRCQKVVTVDVIVEKYGSFGTVCTHCGGMSLATPTRASRA